MPRTGLCWGTSVGSGCGWGGGRWGEEAGLWYLGRRGSCRQHNAPCWTRCSMICREFVFKWGPVRELSRPEGRVGHGQPLTQSSPLAKEGKEHISLATLMPRSPSISPCPVHHLPGFGDGHGGFFVLPSPQSLACWGDSRALRRVWRPPGASRSRHSLLHRGRCFTSSGLGVLAGLVSQADGSPWC